MTTSMSSPRPSAHHLAPSGMSGGSVGLSGRHLSPSIAPPGSSNSLIGFVVSASASCEHTAYWRTSSGYRACTLTTSSQCIHFMWSSCRPVDLLVGLLCPCRRCPGCSQWLRGSCCCLSRPWLSCLAVLFRLPVLQAAPHALLPFSPTFVFIPTLSWSFFICSHS